MYFDIAKSVYDSHHVTAGNVLVLSNVSGPAKYLYKCKSLKAVCLVM